MPPAATAGSRWKSSPTSDALSHRRSGLRPNGTNVGVTLELKKKASLLPIQGLEQVPRQKGAQTMNTRGVVQNARKLYDQLAQGLAGPLERLLPRAWVDLALEAEGQRFRKSVSPPWGVLWGFIWWPSSAFGPAPHRRRRSATAARTNSRSSARSGASSNPAASWWRTAPSAPTPKSRCSRSWAWTRCAARRRRWCAKNSGRVLRRTT